MLVGIFVALSVLHLAAAQPSCKFVLTESIPDGVVYPSGSVIGSPTYNEWSNLINASQSNLQVVVFYFTLAADDVGPNLANFSAKGESILKQLTQKAKLSTFVLNAPTKQLSNGNDSIVLQRAGANVLILNMTAAANLSGVVHTKLWLSDGLHAYVGSANMDWRSLTQVKELGVSLYDCPELVTDMYGLFAVYQYLAQGQPLPSPWPQQFNALYNASHPLTVSFVDGRESQDAQQSFLVQVYLSSSPPPFCSQYRTGDVDAIVQTILGANHFVYIAVMDYFPIIEYEWPLRFWPEIDNAIRRVTLEKRGVGVCLLVSKWSHTRKDYRSYMQSLNTFSGADFRANITVKQFVVPSDQQQSQIPFARVNHNKYMVTDSVAYVGTSNWVGDYFVNTAGVALVAKTVAGSRNLLREQLESVFLRDWNSAYAEEIPTDSLQVRPAAHYDVHRRNDVFDANIL